LATTLASADPTVALSVERIGGLTYSSYGPHALDGTITLSTFGVGGVNLNPTAIPRIGIDVLLPSRLTVGGALGANFATLGVNPNSGQSETASATTYVIAPRIGYRLSLGPKLDFLPRAGVSLVGGSVSTNAITSQTCVSDVNTGVNQCMSTQGTNSANLFAFAISVDAAFALRLTDSFNLLGGLAYDQVVSASASSTDTSGSATHADTGGTYFGLQLWLGVGGYL
jgi:hypothetical protein